METRVNYIAVGLFVIALGTLLIGTGLWIGADIRTGEYKRYAIYFDDSIAGLSRNAPVTYLGVEVGRVTELRLLPEHPERVQVIIETEMRTPVKTDTVAALRMQGLTGIAEIELSGGTRDAPTLQPPEGESYPVIASEPSLMSRLEDVAVEGLQTLERLAGRLETVLSEENLQAVSGIAANLEAITATVAANTDRIERSLTEAERMFGAGADAAESLPQTLARLNASLEGFDTLTATLTETGAEWQDLGSEGRHSIDRVNRSTLPRVDGLITELEVLSNRLTRFSEQLIDQPEMLIFGRPTAPPGPGE